MSVFKKLLKSKKVIGWGIGTLSFIVLVIVVNVVLTTVLADLVNGVLGGERAIIDPEVRYRYFTPDFATKEEALENGNQVTQKICEEGMVLLKNENNALPLSQGAKVSVFGKNSTTYHINVVIKNLD